MGEMFSELFILKLSGRGEKKRKVESAVFAAIDGEGRGLAHREDRRG